MSPGYIEGFTKKLEGLPPMAALMLLVIGPCSSLLLGFLKGLLTVYRMAERGERPRWNHHLPSLHYHHTSALLSVLHPRQWLFQVMSSRCFFCCCFVSWATWRRRLCSGSQSSLSLSWWRRHSGRAWEPMSRENTHTHSLSLLVLQDPSWGALPLQCAGLPIHVRAATIIAPLTRRFCDWQLAPAAVL